MAEVPPTEIFPQCSHLAYHSTQHFKPLRTTSLLAFDAMDDEPGHQAPMGWSRKCVCGKLFFQLNSYSNHINSCKQYKRGLGVALEGAKARYQSRKLNKGKGRLQGLSSRFNDDDLDIDRAPVAGSSQQPALNATLSESPNQHQSISDVLLSPEVSRCTSVLTTQTNL